MYGAINGWMRIVECLLEASADINHIDRFKRNALHYAVKINHVRMIKLLVEYNINVDQCDVHKNDPLKIASKN